MGDIRDNLKYDVTQGNTNIYVNPNCTSTYLGEIFNYDIVVNNVITTWNIKILGSHTATPLVTPKHQFLTPLKFQTDAWDTPFILALCQNQVQDTKYIELIDSYPKDKMLD